MVEYFQLLLTLGAVLLVLLSCLSLLGRFLLAPVMALLALPTYAAMISLEYLVASHRQGKCPVPLQFRKPRTFWKKLCMDFFASYCTIVGGLIAIRIFEIPRKGVTPDIGMAKLIANSSDSNQFMLIAMFWIFLIGVYVVSHFHGDELEHPINKFEDLVIPEWVKKVAEKFTK